MKRKFDGLILSNKVTDRYATENLLTAVWKKLDARNKEKIEKEWGRLLLKVLYEKRNDK